MILQRKPTNEDIVSKIDELFLILQSIDVKWTTPEIMTNFLKLHIKFIDENIEKQIETIINLTSEFLVTNGLLEKGIIDDKYMPEHIGKPGYKMCADFSQFKLRYEDGQITKKDLPKLDSFQECEQ